MKRLFGIVVFCALCVFSASDVHAIDPVAFNMPWADISSPQKNQVFRPGATVSMSGSAKIDLNKGRALTGNELRWTVSSVKDEFNYLHSANGNSSSWQAPNVTAAEEYVVKFWATEKDEYYYETIQQVHIFVAPAGQNPTASEIKTTADGNSKQSGNTSEHFKDRVLVKYPTNNGNSRVGYWQFTFGNTRVDRADFATYDAGGFTGPAGPWELAGRLGTYGNWTWSNQPNNFTKITDLYIDPDNTGGWWNFDITDYYNANLGKAVTLRMIDIEGRGIGPEFLSLESTWQPGGAGSAVARLRLVQGAVSTGGSSGGSTSGGSTSGGDTPGVSLPCHQIQTIAAVPTGFGSPFNVTASTNDLLLKASCNGAAATIDVGIGNNLHYVYNKGYVWTGATWAQFTLTGQAVTADWMLARGNADVQYLPQLAGQPHYFVGYMCAWSGTSWKCGCRDAACTQSFWQLQSFSPISTGGGGSTSSGSTSGGSTSGGSTSSGSTSGGGSCPTKTISGAPYSSSPIICDLSFNWSTHVRKAVGSDNFMTTWADDGNQYTTWGDGYGFAESGSKKSLGFSRVAGNSPGSISTSDLWSGSGKSYGLVSIGGTMYKWVSPGSNSQNYSETVLYRSTNRGGSWSSTGLKYTKGEDLVIPTILQFGQDYNGARDNFVYHYFIEPTSAPNGPLIVQKPGRVFLARVPKDQMTTKSAYQWYTGGTGANPSWGSQNQKKSVFNDPNGVGWNLSVSYNPHIKRYLLSTEHGQTSTGQIGIFDAPEPWGPWTTVHYANNFGSGEIEQSVFFYNFSNKWANGNNFVLIFSGVRQNDAWNTVNGTFTVSP